MIIQKNNESNYLSLSKEPDDMLLPSPNYEKGISTCVKKNRFSVLSEAYKEENLLVNQRKYKNLDLNQKIF